MALPPSFAQKYSLTPVGQVRKRRRLMIGTDGVTNTGKTEFIWSAPGPKVLLVIDRSYDSALDNPNPPIDRNLEDTFMEVIKVPGLGATPQADALNYFQTIRKRLYDLLAIPEFRTVAIDGDSDFWEIQLLAEFGRVSQIPPMAYQMVDGVKRSIANRCWDAEKIIIGTNKVKPLYEDVLDENGLPIIDEKSKRNVQRKVEGEYKRQGFRDQAYLWQLQIRHLFKPAGEIDLSKMTLAERLRVKRSGLTKTKPEWGLKILKCKANPLLEGDELWNEDCNFKGLVQHVYPQVALTEWGFAND